MSKWVVYTGGTFDILHRGHINLLKACKKISGYEGKVVVGLNTDDFIERYKGEAPYRNYVDRKAVLEACKYVDEVVPNEGGGYVSGMLRGQITVEDDFARCMQWLGSLEQNLPASRVSHCKVAKGSKDNDIKLEVTIDLPLTKTETAKKKS